MPYVDFGTQVFGRHNRPEVDGEKIKSKSVWGFWDFYDHWEDYAKPTGKFDLGEKPRDPTGWLRKWHTESQKQPFDSSLPSIPDVLTGLSFSYYPLNTPFGGPSMYRYAVCINTKGWELWWKQVVQWAARVGYDGVFVDNSDFTRCWNNECQEGYRKWLDENYEKKQIRRYFTTMTNNMLKGSDPGIEVWYQDDESGVLQWRIQLGSIQVLLVPLLSSLMSMLIQVVTHAG